VFAEVEQARDLLRSVVSDLEPGCLSGKDAVRLVKRFAEIRRLADAGIALAAKRVDDASAWRDSGQPNAASWLARTTGSTLGSAITALNTAERLEELPATEDAFRKGELSEVQAREVTEAAIVDPSAERRMLEVAGTDTLKGLKQVGARVKAAAIDPKEREQRIHRSRYFRHWTDADGAFRAECKLTAAAGSKVLAVLKPETERRFRQARAAKQPEPHEAYAADALVAVAERAAGGGERGGPRATVLAGVDLARGRPAPGTCRQLQTFVRALRARSELADVKCRRRAEREDGPIVGTRTKHTTGRHGTDAGFRRRQVRTGPEGPGRMSEAGAETRGRAHPRDARTPHPPRRARSPLWRTRR
jgi:hypothetical protein